MSQPDTEHSFISGQIDALEHLICYIADHSSAPVVHYIEQVARSQRSLMVDAQENVALSDSHAERESAIRGRLTALNTVSTRLARGNSTLD